MNLAYTYGQIHAEIFEKSAANRLSRELAGALGTVTQVAKNSPASQLGSGSSVVRQALNAPQALTGYAKQLAEAGRNLLPGSSNALSYEVNHNPFSGYRGVYDKFDRMGNTVKRTVGDALQRADVQKDLFTRDTGRHSGGWLSKGIRDVTQRSLPAYGIQSAAGEAGSRLLTDARPSTYPFARVRTIFDGNIAPNAFHDARWFNNMNKFGQALAKTAAEPWSVLRTGLTHGAISAVPGAAIGGAIGYATAPKEYTREQRLSRAGKGALVGGATTGLAGGGVSALMQRDHRGMYDALGQSNDSIASIFDNFTGIGGDPSLDAFIADSYRNATQAARENFPKTWAG